MIKKYLSKLETKLEKDAQKQLSSRITPTKIYYGAPKLPKKL